MLCAQRQRAARPLPLRRARRFEARAQHERAQRAQRARTRVHARAHSAVC